MGFFGDDSTLLLIIPRSPRAYVAPRSSLQVRYSTTCSADEPLVGLHETRHQLVRSEFEGSAVWTFGLQ